MKTNSKEVILEFKLPEFTRKDIKIKLTKNSLTIKAEKKSKTKISKKDFFHQEISHRNFNYATTLPNIDPKSAKITLNKGILKIKLKRK